MTREISREACRFTSYPIVVLFFLINAHPQKTHFQRAADTDIRNI